MGWLLLGRSTKSHGKPGPLVPRFFTRFTYFLVLLLADPD